MEAGIVVAFAGETVPPGWELCDGRPLDKTLPRYARLFEAIGTLHGGDGNPLFQLPDYRGLFLRGVDHQRGRDPDAGARQAPAPDGTGSTGNRVGSVQPDVYESHAHATQGYHIEGSGGSGFHGAGFNSNSNTNHPWTTQYGTTARGGAETRPRNAYVNYIIAL